MSARDSKPEHLVEEGLQLYSQGRLNDALSKWHGALELAPDHHRAREYVKYVEDNRAALEESFRLAQAQHSGDDITGQTGSEASSVAQPPERGPSPTASDDESPMFIVAEEPPTNQPVTIEPVKDPPPEGGFEDALTNKLYLLTKKRAHSGDEYTPRIDLDQLKERVEETKRRLAADAEAFPDPSTSEAFLLEPPPEGSSSSAMPTPDKMSAAVTETKAGVRDRRATPLTLIDGGGEKPIQDFDPHEVTPVSLIMPKPVRVMGDQFPDPFQVEVFAEPPAEEPPSPKPPREMITPARLSPKVVPLADEKGTAFSAPPLPDLSSAEDSESFHTAPPTKPKSTSNLHLSTKASGGEHELPAPVPPPLKKGDDQLESMVSGARQLFEQGTFEGSYWLCERILAVDPEHAEAKNLQQSIREVLVQQYKAKIGDMSKVPVILVPQHEIVWHKLDHRAGFLLSRIDGQLCFDDLLDVSGMSEFEACRIVAQLIGQGVIGPR